MYLGVWFAKYNYLNGAPENNSWITSGSILVAEFIYKLDNSSKFLGS